MLLNLLQTKTCLLMLDFDGTLVSIAPTPHEVHVSKEIPKLLQNLSQRHQVFIVTGRHSADVQNLIQPALVPVIGLHGLEWPNEETPLRNPFLDNILLDLKPLVRRFTKLFIEDKEQIISIHTRLLEPHEIPIAQKELKHFLESTLSPVPELCILEGHHIFEVRPKEASKAFAVKKLMAKFPNLYPVCIGDDIADEEAFLEIGNLGTCVRVGPPHVHTRAQMRLSTPADVLELLRLGGTA